MPPTLWSERFTPQCEEELVVSKKKVAEVKDFLSGNLSGCRTLILRGPPGSGKAAVLKALAADLGIEVAEWRPLARSEQVQGVSLQESFLTFLSQADRYARLQTNGGFTMSAVNRPCLALVRDFPFTFLDNNNSSREALGNGESRSEQFVQHFEELLVRGELRRAVFCFNNSPEDYRSMKRLFLQSRAAGSVTTIEFPPVAKTFVQRVLDNILKSQGHKPAALGVDTSALATECCGDLRQAITGLQLAAGSISASAAFAAVAGRGHRGKGGGRGARGRAKATALTAAPKSTSSPPTPSASTTSTVAVRNVSLDMFHALGKFLWCKRVPPQSFIEATGKPAAKRARKDANGETVGPMQLPHEILVPKSERPPLYFDPETVLNSTNKEPSVLVDWMFTNAPRFCGDVEDLAAYAQHLAEVDSWTPFPWAGSRGSSGDAGSSVLEESACGVQARALLDANLHPTKPMFDDPCTAKTEDRQDVVSQAALFNLCRPLMAEVWRLCQRRLTDLASQLETLDSLSLGGARAGASTHSRSMMLHTLPFAHLMLLGSGGNHITLRRLPHRLMSLMFELNDPLDNGLRGPDSSSGASDGDVVSQAAMDAWNTALDDDPIED